jgi:hypothetical protein
LAYRGGPHVLDVLLATYAAEIELVHLDDPALSRPVPARTMNLMRAAVAAWRLPVNEMTRFPVMRLVVQHWEREQLAPDRLYRPVTEGSDPLTGTISPVVTSVAAAEELTKSADHRTQNCAGVEHPAESEQDTPPQPDILRPLELAFPDLVPGTPPLARSA